MDRRLLNLGSAEIKKILRNFGFVVSRRRGSHTQYVGIIDGVKRRVTLVEGQQNFAPKTLKSMIEQSGVPEENWLRMS